MKRALSPFVAIFKLVRFLLKSLADAALSLILYRNIKVYLSNHLSVGIHYLSKRKTHFPHPIGIVIGRKVKMGFGCTIYQNVTIGTKETNNPEIAEYPTIEDNVTIFANSVIFGKITIGKDSVIGAGSVVFKDVPPNSLVVGNPARVLVKPAFA